MLTKMSEVNEFMSTRDDDELDQLLQKNQTRGKSKNNNDVTCSI